MLTSCKCSQRLTASSQHPPLIYSHTNDASTLVSRHTHTHTHTQHTYTHKHQSVDTHTAPPPGFSLHPACVGGRGAGRSPAFCPLCSPATPLPAWTRRGRKANQFLEPQTHAPQYTVLERPPESYRCKSVIYSHQIYSHDYFHTKITHSQGHPPGTLKHI